MKKQTLQAGACLFITASLLLAGCANNAANRVRQQGMNMQQNQNQPPATIQPLPTMNPQAGNMDNRIQVSKEAADKITKIGGVIQANVLVTGRNAYVAALMDTTQQMTREIEDLIAQQVRSTDQRIQKVYVSTNPEFRDRVNQYVTDVGQGRPATGFYEQFNEMVQRVFPNAR